MKFLGLAVPDGQGLSAFDDLVAVWRVKENTRFQNYRARFTILQTEFVEKEWLEALVSDNSDAIAHFAPESWKK